MRPSRKGQSTGLDVEGRKKREGLAYAVVAAVSAFSAFAPVPAHAQELTAADLSLICTFAAAGAVALAAALGLWALAEQRAAQRLRRNIRKSGARARAAVGERDALISAAREALVVWGRDGSGPYSYRGADAILDRCLAGPDATALSRALDELGAKGISFTLSVRDAQDKKYSARGCAVGGMAAVWIEEEKTTKPTADFEAILNALPLPVWLRDKALSLKWANQAFLSFAGEASLEQAVRHQTSLEKSERDLAVIANNQRQMTSTKRFAAIDGQRRALEFVHVPLDDGGVVGTALDATNVAAAEAKLQQHIDAHADTLNKITTAIAVFGSDQRLEFYNRAFVRLWELPESWLNKKPSEGEILDRLREDRKLPEQRDYQAWKRARLALYDKAQEQPLEEVWHIPNGATLRVAAQRHPFGGLTVLYEDVTERITLESSYNTLVKVQSATLDTLQEAVAVFGMDGRLKFSNAAFARIWDLSKSELAGEPHVRQVATSCIAKFGGGEVWDKLISSIVAGSERPRDWGMIERSDHTVLSVALSPLPDGATLVTFADVSDHFRIETALRERNEALEAADKLKSEFIQHVSYELRTPLNTILGFAEHLASGVPGELSPRQAEYVQAIVSGGHTLRSLINDILDLSLIEAGALRLELERIDLYVLLSEVAAHVREWAAKAGLELRYECRENVGVFLADGRRIRQVVFNLLSNALKYTPRGGTITLMGDIQGEDVSISVADTGPGIAPEVKPNVFDRFAAKGRSGQRAGAGLGLALVNRFVELHNGWVEIDSNAGQGTVVRCHIPRRVHDDTPDDREIHAAE